jgi:hypothetical protein
MSADKSVVWILGAGFSRALGAPLLGEMLSSEALKRVRATYPALDSGSIVTFESVVANYRHGAYGAPHFPQNERLWLHAEEFLERLDLAARDEVAGRVLQSSWITAPGAPAPESADFVHGWVIQILVPALRLMAAECCAFLERADLRSERWQPYLRWAQLLQPQDAVLTFNYDRVPDLLEERNPSKLHVVAPAELKDRFRTTPVMKLHGSVDWIRHEGTLDRVPPGHPQYDKRNVIALHVDTATQGGIATPGPSKVALVQNQGALGPLWTRAATVLHKAAAIVLVGYSMPPTDAYTRHWLIEQIRVNAEQRGGRMLPVTTVMGTDVGGRDSLRLKGIFEMLTGVSVFQAPMFGEDFLDLFEREDVLRGV